MHAPGGWRKPWHCPEVPADLETCRPLQKARRACTHLMLWDSWSLRGPSPPQCSSPSSHQCPQRPWPDNTLRHSRPDANGPLSPITSATETTSCRNGWLAGTWPTGVSGLQNCVDDKAQLASHCPFSSSQICGASGFAVQKVLHWVKTGLLLPLFRRVKWLTF